MTFHVRIGKSATREIEQAYQWLLCEAPLVHADAWLDGLRRAIAGFAEFPNRHGLAREAATTGLDVRQLLYGKRPHVDRVLFLVIGETVHVMHVRHGARNQLWRGEIDLPPEV
jgi:toxin ParE1/3/4